MFTECSENSTADVVFLLDMSSSVTGEEFLTMLNTAHVLADDLDRSKTRFAAVGFHGSPILPPFFWLNTYTSVAEVHTELTLLQRTQISGMSNVSTALRFVGDNCFLTQNGGREETSRLVIVLTTGKADDIDDLVTETLALKAKNVTVVAVGVGENVDGDMLHKLAHDSFHVYRLPSDSTDMMISSAFLPLRKELRYSICTSRPNPAF
jgi:uncharacterized protein YegL